MFIESNMRQNHLFILEIDGVDQLLIQELTTPDVELQEMLHGGPINSPDIKTPGKKKVGDLTLKKIAPINGVDNFAWVWLEQAATMSRGAYARNVVLRLTDETGLRTLARFAGARLWPKKISGMQLKRSGDSENSIEEVLFSCTDWVKLPEVGA